MNYRELLQLTKGWGNFISDRINIWRLLFTNTSLSDKFPDNVGQGEMVIRYPAIDMDIKIV